MSTIGMKSFYYRLPYVLKVGIASIYGLRMRYWRYGPHYDAEKKSAIIREGFDRGQIEKYQQTKLRQTLRLALQKVSWYQQNVPVRPDEITTRNAHNILKEFPIIEKETLRKKANEFISSDFRVSDLYEEHTSGTTGTPLKLYWSKRMVESWYALAHVRWLYRAGVSENDRWAMLGGQAVADVNRNVPPYWVENLAMKQLYLSVYHLSPNTIVCYLEKLKNFKPAYLIAYPSAISTIVSIAEDLGVKWNGPRINRVIGNAEPFFEYQRERIENFFGTKTVDTYGASEGVFMGNECNNGKMHISPDVGWYEILDENNDPVPKGASGHFVCTGFLNAAMPLIRYKTGDQLAFSKRSCSCGSSFPVIKEIVGRTDDLIRLPNGRIVGRLDPILKADFPVKEVQFIQKKVSHIVVKLVPSAGYDSRVERRIISAVVERLGDQVNIVIEKVNEIPRTKSGKFRAVVNEQKL